MTCFPSGIDGVAVTWDMVDPGGWLAYGILDKVTNCPTARTFGRNGFRISEECWIYRPAWIKWINPIRGRPKWGLGLSSFI